MIKTIVYLWIHHKGWCKPLHGCRWKGEEMHKKFCPFLAAVYSELLGGEE